jgi:hypothetical protein
MKEKLLKIFEEIFRTYGYRITRDTFFDLIAEREETIFIRYMRGDEKPEEINRNGRIIMMSLSRIEDSIIQKFNRHGIEIWDRDRIMYEIGKAVVQDLEGVSEVSPSYGISNYSISEVTDYMDAEKSDERFSREVIFLKTFPVRVSREEVEAKSRSEVGRVDRVILKLVPHWKYSFTISHTRKIGDRSVEINEEGNGFFNAVNGVEEKDIHGSLIDSLEVEGDYSIEPPKIPKDKAEEMIVDLILKRYTKKLKIKKLTGDSYIVETIVVKPSRKDLTLELDMIYLPVWEVSGQRGVAFYNATSGTLLEIPVDDDVEIIQ